MNYFIKIIQDNDKHIWDAYVKNHHQATLYHLFGWKNVIEKTYGLQTYYFMAVKSDNSKNDELSAESYAQDSNAVVGILPLVHLKHFLFGNSLISLPFFDFGGILADNDEAGRALLSKAISLGKKLKVKNIELRNVQPITWINDNSKFNGEVYRCSNKSDSLFTSDWTAQTWSQKVRMFLILSGTSETLMKSFKSKLRSQIRKPLKEGLKIKIGGIELLEDFYSIFSVNMRDLGSPVHSKRLMQNVITEFQESAKIFIVNLKSKPLACSLVIGFNDTLENPWASSLRTYSKLSPNMLLYWSMLKYACDCGYKNFDFGRCTLNSGTYKFKEQWGAEPNPLYWYYISRYNLPINESLPKKSLLDKASNFWKKLPVPLTQVAGPIIRKHIGL